MMLRLAVLLFIAAALAVPAHAAQSDAALRAGLQSDLSQYLRSRAKAEHISAISLSVSVPNSPDINVAVGTTQYGGAGTPVTPRNLYQIGSNTKAFTSAAILELEAEGKLNIDQTVGRWLPQYPAWKNITIRRLLNMTSGIPTYDAQPSMLAAYARHPMRTWTTKELVAVVYPMIDRSDKWLYSNTAYILSEMIVERASHSSYANVLRKRFLNNPAIGLQSTYYEPSFYPPSVTRRLVSGYFASTDADNAALAPLLYKDMKPYSLSWTHGAGGIISSPQDVARWVRALYEGPVLAPQQRRELETIVSQKTGKPMRETTASDTHGFGLGVGNLYAPPMGRVWFYEGMTLGYRMLYAYLPSSHVVYAVGINSQPTSTQNQSGRLMQAIYLRLKNAGKL